jgi:hypothetical protein
LKTVDRNAPASTASPPAYDTVVAVRYLLGAASAGGADARQMAQEARPSD